MKENAHIIAIPFTGVGLHSGYRGDTWFKHRIEIFKNYTLKSLKNQSNKDFIIWCWFRPEEAENPLVDEIRDALAQAGLRFIFTFHGLMYHDDKFNDYNLRTKIRNLFMMVWDMWIYKEWKSPKELWKYTWEDKNKTLLNRLRQALHSVQRTIGSDYDWVYLTRLDSDDMLHKEAVNCIQASLPEYKKALVFDKGYIYNVITKQVAEWNPPTNPPFHTIIFPAGTFFDAHGHKEYYGSFTSHEDIRKVFDCETLDVHKYMVSFHGKHISTAWNSDPLRKIKHVAQYGSGDPFRGEEILPKGYCYTTNGRNISTRWESHLRHEKNSMIGNEFETQSDREQILSDFGLAVE
mgnify:CR=1 FL=1